MPSHPSSLHRVAATTTMRQFDRVLLRQIACEAAALLARIDEWTPDGLNDENARDWMGHVDPPLERLRGLLNFDTE